ncbi:LAQU0S02e01398g1_1 [Lachancea quebecensis]|uniref:LAQU0S02e01398g1_1 n=1 Tax=Lachancea quebecensis TaxID=1654605 RepID=A0A0N7ML03_9SACH|nr:LAQU0S02e01398g1_1 [Lachancea quebecensis]
MGYIQFDKVDVPEDNVVSLGLLNRQLQKQQLGQLSELAGLGDEYGSEYAHEYRDEYRDEYANEYAHEYSGEYRGKSVHTTLSATSASIAQTWHALLGFDHYDGTSDGKPSLDEETCGVRFDTVPLSSPTVSSSSSSGTSSSGISSCTERPAHVPATAASSGDCGSGAAAPLAFQCAFCPSSFKVKGYLTRHMKKHLVTKDFQCPFWSGDCRCHASGEFSRKDTYKTHLKSVHFVYPVGVAKSQRGQSKGRCAACYQEFGSNMEWLLRHVETRQCEALVQLKREDAAGAAVRARRSG